jgi:hypothetical protein
MNHKLLRMLNEAGFEFTPDIMAKLPAFENLVWLEREACANICKEKAAGWREEDMHTWPDGRRSSMGDCWHQHRAEGADDCEAAIRARGQDD